jgi:hypothetical protein
MTERRTMTTTELMEIDATSITPATFSVDLAEIQRVVSEYGTLTISGPDDKPGYIAVRAARLDCRSRRTAIDKRRKELNEGALEYQRRVNGQAKELTALIEPGEERLTKIETAYDKQIEAAKAAVLQSRVDALSAIGCTTVPLALLGPMTDKQWEATLAIETARHAERVKREAVEAEAREVIAAAERETARREAERVAKAREEAEAERLKRQAEADAARAVEDERLKAERLVLAEAKRIEEERLAGERAALAAQKAELEAARKTLEAEQSEQRRLVEIERVKREAAESERLAAIQREEQRLADELSARAEKDAADKLAPDVEKLRKYIAKVAEVKFPEVSEEAEDMRDAVDEIISRAIRQMRAAIGD